MKEADKHIKLMKQKIIKLFKIITSMFIKSLNKLMTIKKIKIKVTTHQTSVAPPPPHPPPPPSDRIQTHPSLSTMTVLYNTTHDSLSLPLFSPSVRASQPPFQDIHPAPLHPQTTPTGRHKKSKQNAGQNCSRPNESHFLALHPFYF